MTGDDDDEEGNISLSYRRRSAVIIEVLGYLFVVAVCIIVSLTMAML